MGLYDNMNNAMKELKDRILQNVATSKNFNGYALGGQIDPLEKQIPIQLVKDKALPSPILQPRDVRYSLH